MFKLLFTLQASQDLDQLENDLSLHKRYKAVIKALGYLENNPRHPCLNTHKYFSLQAPHGEEVFEAYAENNPPQHTGFFGIMAPIKNKLLFLLLHPTHNDLCLIPYYHLFFPQKIP